MSEITFEDVYQFIVDAFPQYKNDKLSVNKIKELLKKLLNDRMDELTVAGIHHDDWPDDDEILELGEYINIIDKSN
jgi:hypothetical protein